jgi:hypothetical protein
MWMSSKYEMGPGAIGGIILFVFLIVLFVVNRPSPPTEERVEVARILVLSETKFDLYARQDGHNELARINLYVLPQDQHFIEDVEPAGQPWLLLKKQDHIVIRADFHIRNVHDLEVRDYTKLVERKG